MSGLLPSCYDLLHPQHIMQPPLQQAKTTGYLRQLASAALGHDVKAASLKERKVCLVRCIQPNPTIDFDTRLNPQDCVQRIV